MLLEENPSTGWEWIVDHDATNGLFKIEEVFVPADDTENLGVPGRREFTLTFGNTSGECAFRVA